MKLDIKKDMYIRTKDGIIDKVIFDYKGGIMSRLNADNTLRLNKTCLKDRGE